jgi:hypothetical protein
VYSQELTDEINLITKMSDVGIPYHGVQFILHSSDKLHHEVDDDDRSAVTFWLPHSTQRRESMAKVFEKAAAMFREAPPETGLD